jgi:osmoprotectant transport system substrate-binding protein
MKKHLRLLLALLAAFALFTAACSDDDDSSDSGSGSASGTEDSTPAGGGDVGDVPTITMGVQDFGESAILSEIYGQVLEANGYTVEYQDLGGFRDLEEAAFEGGEINFAASEYVASMLLYIDDTQSDIAADLEDADTALTELLAEGEFGGTPITAYEPAEAVDTNTFVVAEDSDLESLADVTEETVLGAPQDCESNAFCIPGIERVYGVDLSGSFTPLEGGPQVLAALDNGDIEVGVIFSTSGLLADGGYTTLEDPEGLIAADNVVPVATEELAEAGGADLETLINDISAQITTDDLVALNERYDVDAEDAEDIAADFIEEKGL